MRAIKREVNNNQASGPKIGELSSEKIIIHSKIIFYGKQSN
jgi:hypothetical protein